MTTARHLAQRLAKAATHVVGRYCGEHFPFYYVCEYPKSGGTWLAQMVSDYLQVPFPRYSVFPIGCEAVILNHWPGDPRLRRVCYVYRDGRDVMTSFFLHRLRIAKQVSHPASSRVCKDLQRLFGADYAEKETGPLLARFIDQEFRDPRLGSKVSWSRHVEQWHQPEMRSHTAYVSYEGLLRDTPAELAKVIEEITGRPTDAQRIEATAAKFSMLSQTGRRPGEESSVHHIRKGIAGDWKNHFTRECAETFHQHAGDALIDLGYETDPLWVERAFREVEDR